MQAVVYRGRGRVVAEEIERPRPGAGHVLLAIKASGTCRADIDILLDRFGNPPVVPGHEFAGEIVELGAGVKGLSVGERVVVDPNITCGECRSCALGNGNLCEHLEVYGLHRDGGLAEFAVVRAANVVPIGTLPYEIAALAEPVGCILNGLSTISPGPHDTALIFGAGPIGLLVAMTLRQHALPSIAMVDILAERLERVESLGFRGVPVGSESLIAMRRGADIVVDATGIPSVVGSLLDHVADGGRTLFFGICPPDFHVPIAPFDLFRRQITLSGGRLSNHNLAEALAAIRAFGSDIGRLVSHRLPLSEMAAVLAGRGPVSALKVQAVME